MANENVLQIQDWNGPVGERWAAEQEATDPLIRPFGEAAMAAACVKAGERVLDVGCGCGDTSLALAGAAGSTGSVLGLDVSAPMLAVARGRKSVVCGGRCFTGGAAGAVRPVLFAVRGDVLR